MNIISLFSGAGGLDLGFKQAGFNIVWANEKDPKVKKTYEYNHATTKFLNRDIREIPNAEIPSHNIDGIIGGPPCQSWSVAGNMKGKGDQRGALLDDYLRVISHVKPKFFLFENVKGIISRTHIDDFHRLLDDLKEIGYVVNYELLNSVDFSVPQTRERVFIVGFLENLHIDFEFPQKRLVQVTLKEALVDLPPQKPYNRDTSLFDSHEYVTGTFSSIFMSRNRVRRADQPSYTIQASGRQTPLHYSSPEMIKIAKDECKFAGPIESVRRLSVRECARIQTFPDDFQFIYSNINDAYRMIGNAVPVHLAQIIANKIKHYLNEEQQSRE